MGRSPVSVQRVDAGLQAKFIDLWIHHRIEGGTTPEAAYRLAADGTLRNALVRKDIAAIKVAMPKVYGDIATKAAHLHGALGVSNEMPFMGMVTSAMVMGIADGPTEVHKVTVAKQVLKDYRPDNDLFPSYHIPKLREEARERFKDELEELKSAYEAEGRGRGARATETA